MHTSGISEQGKTCRRSNQTSILLIIVVCAIHVLLPTRAFPLDVDVHEKITRDLVEGYDFAGLKGCQDAVVIGAILPDEDACNRGYASDLLSHPPLGITPWCEDNRDAPWLARFLSNQHFDNNLIFDVIDRTGQVTYKGGISYVNQKIISATSRYIALLNNVNNDRRTTITIEEGDTAYTIFTDLGRALHAIQDFYAHTNWLEGQLDDASLYYISPYGSAGDLPLWDGCSFIGATPILSTRNVLTSDTVVIDGLQSGFFGLDRAPRSFCQRYGLPCYTPGENITHDELAKDCGTGLCASKFAADCIFKTLHLSVPQGDVPIAYAPFVFSPSSKAFEAVTGIALDLPPVCPVIHAGMAVRHSARALDKFRALIPSELWGTCGTEGATSGSRITTLTPGALGFRDLLEIINSDSHFQALVGEANRLLEVPRAEGPRFYPVESFDYDTGIPKALLQGTDNDHDGAIYEADNCPHAPNPGHQDTDADGVGDQCDNCPTIYDPTNLICNACLRNGGDSDYDEVCEDHDNCPTVFNVGQEDEDHDGVGDECDPCTDADADGYGRELGSTCPKGAEPDCDDRSPLTFPGAPELCDSVDNDCDGLRDEDLAGMPITLVRVPESLDFVICPGGSSVKGIYLTNGGSPACADLTFEVRATCADGNGEVQDQVGNNQGAQAGENRYRGNVYRSGTSTHLTKIEAYLNFLGPRTLEFIVYESDSDRAGYVGIARKQVEVGGTGEGFYSSGAMSVPLRVGRYYTIATGWDGGAITYYFTPTSGTVSVSFGERIDGFSLNTYPALDTLSSRAGGNTYYQRLTTTDAWVSISPAFGRIRPGDILPVQIIADATVLQEGNYNCSLEIRSNDLAQPTVQVPTAVAVGSKDSDGDGFNSCVNDCDDSNAEIRPGAAELCDVVDNDCDQSIDEGFGVGQSCRVGVGACERSGKLVCTAAGLGTRCDAVPGTSSEETCNNIDDDCDGIPDDGLDPDGDGFCIDCCPEDAACFPGAPEICDLKDNDCDGEVDEGFDVDDDEYTTCEGDCNDNAKEVNPGMPEVCNGVDDNCNAGVDEGFDQDGDGHTTCRGDCDDQNHQIHPGATEQCNGYDDDCDGQVDEEQGTLWCGIGACARTVPACIDGVPQECVPGMPTPEICNGIDDDCDGSPDEGFDPRHCFTYTTTADFEGGVIVNLSAENDELKLTTQSETFPFIWIALSGRGTIAKVDTATGTVLGEYYSSPSGRSRNPSRTAVDLNGNVWAGNRDEVEGGRGSAIHIGLIENNQCVDRNGNGLIDTSTGLGDARPWPNSGGVDNGGGITSAADECILHYVRVNGRNTRTVAVDVNNNVWIGGYNFSNEFDHDLVDGRTGAILKSIQPGCGGYGGLLDRNGVLWSADPTFRRVLRYDPQSGSKLCIGVPGTSYGLGVDSQGDIWNSLYDYCTIVELDPAGNRKSGPHYAGGCESRGVVVGRDDNVWIANTRDNNVGRLAPDGRLLAQIRVGSGPTGVSIDTEEEVWVTDIYSDDARRINPANNQVDLIAYLGGGAYPYNYSDMTGFVIRSVFPNRGTWTAIRDSGTPGTRWGKVHWDSSDPIGATVFARCRSAETEAGLLGALYVDCQNGVEFDTPDGRFLQVEVTLRVLPPSANALQVEGLTPVVRSVTIETTNQPPLLGSVGDKSAQYSDPIVPYQVLASDPNDSCGALSLAADGLPQALGFHSESGCQGIVSGLALAPAGAYPVTYSVTDPLGLSDVELAEVFESKEFATAEYTGDVVVSGIGSRKDLAYRASILEEADGSFGNIIASQNQPGVIFHVCDTPADDAAMTCREIPAASVISTETNGTWIGTSGEPVPDGIYLLTIRFDSENQYFTGPETSPPSVFCVASPSNQSATGGGWLYDPTESTAHGNFGFTVRYRKTGQIQGESLFIYRDAGLVYRFKATAWDGLAFPAPNRAKFQGKCNLKVTDALTGEERVDLSHGNLRCLWDVVDNGEPGRADTYSLTVRSADGTLLIHSIRGALEGGNIQVHSGKSLGP